MAFRYEYRINSGPQQPVGLCIAVLDKDCTGRGAAIGNVTHLGTTDQEQAEALYLLDSLLTGAPVGLVFLDRDLRFVRINDRLAEINGMSIAAHLGRTVAEILPTLEATLREVTARILATGQPVLNHEFSGETARAPGITRYWNESWYPVRDKRGEIIGFGAVVEDVTERKQAEAALLLANQRFNLAVKASTAVLWQQDLDLRFTWLHNPAPGIDGSNAVGKREADLLERAEDVAGIERLKREVISSGVAMRQEFSSQIQGVVRCFDLLMEPLRDTAGVVTGITGAAIEITERKRAEAAHREIERDFRALAEASSEIPYRMSADWSALLQLDGGNLFARPDRPLTDWTWMDQYLPRDEHARVRQVISNAIAGKSLFEMEHLVLRPDGSIGWVRSRAVPVLDDNGGLVAWFGAASDITERKRAEKAQREIERDFRALAEASLEIPYSMSADWSTMQALDGREMVSSSDQPLEAWAWLDQNIPRDEHAGVRQVISNAIAGKSLFEMEHRVLRPDGSIGWVRSRAVPVLDDNGGLVAWFGAASDITERKRIEQNLIETTAVAEEANRAKSDFLSSMSHELRTPLNAILGFAQLLESGPTPLTTAQKRGNDQVVAAGWYLLGLINEILDLAQIDAGKVVLSWESISVADVMRECQSLVEPLAQIRGITMHVPQFDIPYFVRGDRIRFKQILLNLLSNAVKYNKPQGSVSVEYTLATPDSIRIGVRDTGAGLTPEELAQLFEPFNRLGRNATVEGAGIGLVVAKRLVELMGGSIAVESCVGVGSLFWIELMAAPAPPSDVAEAEHAMPVRPPAHHDAPRKTVLYVEDNPANLAVVEELFTRHPDLCLLTATDASVGIELARKCVPDVILMDINLPGMNGIQAMQTLRADPSTSHIPVIAVSAYAMPSEIQRAVDAGFFSYLTKPLHLKEFMSALDVAIKFSQTKSAPADTKNE